MNLHKTLKQLNSYLKDKKKEAEKKEFESQIEEWQAAEKDKENKK